MLDAGSNYHYFYMSIDIFSVLKVIRRAIIIIIPLLNLKFTPKSTHNFCTPPPHTKLIKITTMECFFVFTYHHDFVSSNNKLVFIFVITRFSPSPGDYWLPQC